MIHLDKKNQFVIYGKHLFDTQKCNLWVENVIFDNMKINYHLTTIT